MKPFSQLSSRGQGKFIAKMIAKSFHKKEVRFLAQVIISLLSNGYLCAGPDCAREMYSAAANLPPPPTLSFCGGTSHATSDRADSESHRLGGPL